MAKLDVPYCFTESTRHNIKNALTVNPGSVPEFASGSQLAPWHNKHMEKLQQETGAFSL